MRYHFMLFICVSLCDGFPNIADDEEKEINLCNPNPCKNGGSCVERNDVLEGFSCSCLDGYGGEKCEIASCEENPCENGGSCIELIDGETKDISCNCTPGYTGEKCEIDQCRLMCPGNQTCTIEDGDVKCKIEDPCKSNTCENGGSCRALEEEFVCICIAGYRGRRCELDECSLLQCNEDHVCVAENGEFKCKMRGRYDDTSEEPATTISIKVTSTTTVTTHEEKDNKTTTSENSVKTTTVTETSNTHQLLNSSSTTRSTIVFTKPATKITKTTKNEVATTTRVSRSDLSSTSVERTSETNTDDHHKHFTVTPSSPIVGNTTSFYNNTIKTSRTLTDGLTTIEYATNTENVFKSSSQTSPKISSHSSTSMSTFASPDNSGYISERPQVIVSISTESKEETEITNFKSSGSYASTTETLNTTSATNHDSGNDINRTNASSETIKIYASVGTVCFAVLVAFAVGGWYIRRRYRRRKRQCYTECDTSSQISGNSDSSYRSP